MVSGSNDDRAGRAGRAVVSRRIREVLRARGWTLAILAAAVDRSEYAVVNLAAGGNVSPRARLRLELALKTAFWSDPASFAAALKVVAFYGGAHPRTLSLRRLDALASEHLRGAADRGRIRPRATLIARLESYAIAANAAA